MVAAVCGTPGPGATVCGEDSEAEDAERELASVGAGTSLGAPRKSCSVIRRIRLAFVPLLKES